MANNENLIPIPGRLHSVATEGHVSGADEIYDDTQQKDQETINSELIAAVGTGGSVDSKIAAAKAEIIGSATSACDTLGEAEALISAEVTRATNVEDALDGRVDTLEDAVGTGGSVDSRISDAVATETTRAQAAEADRYTKSETYTKTEVNGLVDTPHQEYVTVDAYSNLPATGSEDTIYRVSGYNGSTSQVDASVYSEYAWNGSQYIFLCVKSQIGEVFDISVYNNNAKYADLAAALNGGANIPQSLQKGGMSVKFVQSSDNKYVQYRLMAQSFSTNIADWNNCEEQVKNLSASFIYDACRLMNVIQKLGISAETSLETNRLTGFCHDGGFDAVGADVSYGFRYIAVQAGTAYRVKGMYSVNQDDYYDGLLFASTFPATGNKADIVIDANVANEAMVDKIFVPANNGYLLMYTFTEAASEWEFYEVDINYDYIQSFANLFNRDEQAFSSRISDIEATKNAANLYVSFSPKQSEGYIGGFAGTTGRFVLAETSYGFKYIQVKKYHKYRVHGNYSVTSAGYAGILFTETLPVTGTIGQVFDVVESSPYIFDKTISFAKDGYLLVWCASVENDVYFDECLLRENSGEPIEFSIEGFVYKDGTVGYGGVGYYITDYIDITQFDWLEAKTKANDYIVNIAFFDNNKTFLPELQLETTDYYTWLVNLKQPKYSSVKYVILGTLAKDGYTLDDFYAKFYRKDYSNKQNVIARYNKLSCIGDSLTNSTSWSAIVCRYLDIMEYTHTGAQGLTMADVQGENSIHASIMSMQTDNDVDIITLWAGTNDFAYNIPIGDFDQQLAASVRDTTTFYGAFIESVEHLLQLFPKARLILIGTTDRVWRDVGTSDPWNDAMTDEYGTGYLPDYVDAVKKVAEHYSLPFLDLLRTSGINKFNISNFMFLQSNGEMEYYLHFNENGRWAIAKRIAAFIDAIG